MALTIYVEVTELGPSFLEHSETREKHHIKSSMMGKNYVFFMESHCFCSECMIRRNQSLLQKQDICFNSVLWSYGTGLMHNQSSTATSHQLQVT